MATVEPRRDAKTPLWDNDAAIIGVRLTWEQFREINRLARIRPFGNNRARSEYVVGCLFGEPREQLLERVHRIAAEELAQCRAEDEAARKLREQRE
jgi:hypothetical protein